MKSFLTLLFGIPSIAVLLLASPAEAQTRRYAIITGDPQGGIPDSAWKYMDANSGCQAEIQVPADTACENNHPDTLRSALGAHPLQPSACIYNWDCTCGFCQIGEPSNPQNFNKISVSQTNAHGQALTCTGGSSADFASCTFHKGKGKGSCPDGICRGNPANILSGNKFQSETLYRSGSGDLDLVLWYNSQAGVHYFAAGAFGAHWTSRYFVQVKDSLQGIIAVNRPDGKELEFRAPESGAFYLKDADVNETLEKLVNGAGATIGWRLTDSLTDDVEEFDATGKLLLVRNRAGRQLTMTYSTSATPPAIAPAAGLLITVSDHFGRQLNFTYNAQKRVAKLIDPGGGETLFEYDGPSGPAAKKNLTKVTFPDLTTRIYHYSESVHINGGTTCESPSPALPNALTGLTDEKGVRFATWTYQCNGRVTGSEHAGGVDKYTFTGHGTFVTVVDPLNTSRDVALTGLLGIGRETGTTQPAASGTGTASTAITYDGNGNVSSFTDFNGNRTDYPLYELPRNLERTRIEGATTPQARTISTEWHTTFRLPTEIAEPLRKTTFAYDPDGTQCGARGALCSKSIQATTDVNGSQGFSATAIGAPRTWTYTYNANGDVLTVNGPRTDVADVTTYTYYANNDPEVGKRGRIHTITNAAGHVTSVTDYNEHGQPTRIVDPNGLVTTMTYYPRLRLETRTVGDTETTAYHYDPAGQLDRVTLPGGLHEISYDYDDAHRLKEIRDNLENRVVYDLDAMGNRKEEHVYASGSSAVVEGRKRDFDVLNRLSKEFSVQSPQHLPTKYGYDDQGNLRTVENPLGHITTNEYDALNRLKQVTSPSPISAVTQYGYNGLDALTQVIDPRGFATGYAVDGLGNLNQQTSPDTGTTTNTYDDAGNLRTQTDAKSQTTTYDYDVLNRVTLITFHDKSKQTYTYDEGVNAIGRLSSIREANPAGQVTSRIAYTYDPHGRVASDTRTTNGVHVTSYRYDSAGRLDQITYPSGRIVTYTLDGIGRISHLSSQYAGQSQTLVSNVVYHPFGGVKSYTLGNGQAYTRGIDLDGRIASYTLGAQSFAVGYDEASRISSISQIGNPPNSNIYGYDNLDRLDTALLPGGMQYTYSYDAVGNRLSRTGSSIDAYGYGTTNNRLASITSSSGPVRNFVFDLNGSTEADGNNTYAYDVRGRMKQATSSIGATDYQVNALGQRIRKTNSLGDTVFGYDQGGRLLAEISATTGEDYLFPMNGTTILPSEGYVRTVADLSWRVAGSGDFNGDGRGDILWRHFTTGDNYIYFMNGTTISAEGNIRTVADMSWKIAGVGDFNGDGKSDIFWRNSATGENYVYLMNGTTISGEGYVQTVADQTWQVAGVGDFDGDGRSDVLWRNSSSGENYVYFMDGTTILSSGYIRTVADLNWRVAGVGKFDADAKSDIFWHKSSTGETYLYPMDGLTIKPTEGYIRTVSTIGWQVKGVADLDGDARADVVWRNAITGENYLWPMDGLAIKATEGYFRTVDLDWQIAAIRDYDGDGKADIFWRRGQDQQPSREYVYLGDMPVGVFLSGSPIAHYIHVDHLNTPRLVANQSGQTVWRWDQQEPFGASLPDENPSGLGAFEFPMRFPGQYFDKETNLHYNYFRDYDPSLGRYVESDPIGLRGGLNLYGYVDGSPLTFSDPSGLSYVEYDGPSNLLCLFSKQGMPLGCWPAYNNLCPGILKTKWQAGQSYTFSWLSRRASPQSVGPNGNFIFNVPGCNGCGVHSGRSSPQACTDGCIRTTDTGTSTMLQTHRNDPITHIDIK